MIVAPGENGDDGQAANDDNLQNEYSRSHNPVERDDAGAVVSTSLTSFRTRKTHESPYLIVEVFDILRIIIIK